MTGPDHGDGGDRLEQLDARLAKLRKAQSTNAPHQEDHYSKAQQGWRMVSELVAGLVIGFGIGYGLDVLLGTTPILLVLFTLLGFAAGVRVMMRTAAEFAVRPPGGHGTDTDGRDSGADR